MTRVDDRQIGAEAAVEVGKGRDDLQHDDADEHDARATVRIAG